MKQKILLPKFRYENSNSEDLQLRVNLKSQENILKNDDRNIVLSLSEQFFKEKNNCKNYKIFGKIKMIFRNFYFGESKYKYLQEKLSLIPNANSPDWIGYLPYNEFSFLRNDICREKNNYEDVDNFDTFTGFTFENVGDKRHKIITSLDKSTYNWNFYLSYVYSGETMFPMKYTLSGESQPHLSFLSGDGIVFRVEETNNSFILTSPVKHGMNQGEYIIINNTPYYINSVGNEIFNSENYVIYLNKSQFSDNTLNGIITGKRCLDNKNISGTTSQYYVHKHKTLTNYDDCKIDNLGFESPIFEDEKKVIFENSVGENDKIVERNRMESIIYDFNKPFILTGLTNNLGFEVNDIYLTVIFRNGNGYFLYPPKIGYSFNFHNNWIDLHFSGDTSNESSISGNTFTKIENNTTFSFKSGNTLPLGTVLYGAFVEYIPTEMRERIISESIHKLVSNPSIFDHNQTDSDFYYGSSELNPVGLYYQPHYRIKLRELSSYIETSSTNNIINLPDNAKYFPDEKLWKWRDVYDLGYFDDNGNGVDFSYMNNILYVHNDINFYLKNERQFKNKEDGVKKFRNINSSSLSSLIKC